MNTPSPESMAEVMTTVKRCCDLEGVEGATPPTPNHSFKTMTTFNTDYNNTELLDQELTTAELSQVSGGLACCYGPSMDPVINGLHGIADGVAEFMLTEATKLVLAGLPMPIEL